MKEPSLPPSLPPAMWRGLPAWSIRTEGRHAPFGPALAAAWVLGAAGWLVGCATTAVPPPTLTAASGAASFEARSLDAPALRAFLRENVGHEGGPWDFETLCWVAFFYHPGLEVARAQWETAQAAERTAGQRVNPSLSVTPGYNFTRAAGVSPWMPSIGADVLLPTGGKRARQQAVARAEAQVARYGVVTAAWQVRGELRRALAEHSVATRRAALLRTQADCQREVLQLVEQRFGLGAASATDVSTIRTAYLRAEAAAADASAAAASALSRVAAALGLPALALHDLTLPMPPAVTLLDPPAPAAARTGALQSRADVLAALARYDAAQAALELEVAKRIPDVHLGPSYQWDQGDNKWSLGLTIELPVFHRNEGPVAEALARRNEAAANFNLVQNQAVAAIDGAAAALAAAQSQLRHARDLRAETARAAGLAAGRQQLGSGDQLEVRTADLDVLVTDAVVLDAESAVAAASGQLEEALQLPAAGLAALTAPKTSTPSHTR